ncbi:hypothetical protein CROQUDRAFT_101808 [Cronartium quercuum f. sp. fusiforme G11]|uniref:Uncharacterized protein n=1 Tax=Cronartium quercuum f. sp. fusiforme G11 TaxID=708437 RepID=A0A9P6N8G4_9BASI|nr:hypothetical protein CROQUDRAFT_101808 [Cronartium quercuum f. sp. fusiforme G11]
MASTTGTSHSIIKKLNETNYAEWKTNLYRWMLEHGLSTFISETSPASPTDEDKKEEFLSGKEEPRA